MKKIYLLLIVVIIGCKKSSTDQVDPIIITNDPTEHIDHTKAIQFVFDFYANNYGTDDLDTANTFTKLLSKRVKDRMDELSGEDNLILNYDPFIQAQYNHYDPTMIAYTLKVNHVSDTKNEYKVSFKLSEGQIEPPTVIIIKVIEKDGSYLVDSVINDQYLSFEDAKSAYIENNETTNKQNVLSAINPEFYGAYHLTQDKGKIDEFSSIVIGYSIEIKKDSVLFSGQGYQTNFYDLCTATQNKDTLNIYYKSSIEGTEYNKNINSALVKLYKSGEKYYAKSPAIWVDAKPSIEVPFDKTY